MLHVLLQHLQVNFPNSTKDRQLLMQQEEKIVIMHKWKGFQMMLHMMKYQMMKTKRNLVKNDEL